VVVVVLLPLSLSMDDGEAVDNAMAAVVVPLAAVTAAAVVAVDNEDGVQCWRWGGGGIQWQRPRWDNGN
jgi:hypothetical protein